MAIVPSYFGNLADPQNLQAMIDNSQDALNSQSIWRNYLTVGTPSASLTFEAVIGRNRIEAAASIVDPDSKKPIRSMPGMEIYTGKIPSIQQKIPMNQADFRSMMMLETLVTSDQARKNEMLRLLFDNVQRAATAPDKRIDIMLLQAISTLQVDVNVTNNPDGVNYGVVDLLANAYQKQGVPVAWTDTVNSDPLTDIENFVFINSTTRGRTFGRIQIPFELWAFVKRNAKIKNALSNYFTGKANQTVVISLARVNEYMADNSLPPFEIINHTVGIEDDGKIRPLRPFDPNNVSFIPAGYIGELKNAIAVEERIKAEHVKYALYGRTLVSKWMENDPVREWTGCELNGFPAVDIDSIYILETDNIQASFI